MKGNRGASRLRKSVGVVLAAALMLGWFSPAQKTLRELPEVLTITQGQTRTLLLGAGLSLQPAGGDAAVSASQDETLGTVALSGEGTGAADMLLSLLGIPLRKVEVQVSPEKRLIPGGEAVGVAMRTDGVLVVGVSEVSQAESPAQTGGIRPGDVLRAVDGVTITGAEQLSSLIAEKGAHPLSVEFLRNGMPMRTTMTPRIDEASGTVRMGAWVRDSTAGVGTLSFYDPETGRYGALGHAITDGDTGAILTVGEGQLLRASIVAVQKGKKGAPGELKGSFLREAHTLGSITRNSALGIYGMLDEAAANPLYPDGVPIGLQDEVTTGPAQILSTVDAAGVRAYDIEILRVNRQTASKQKSMLIRVTDPDLLEKTGGIVQGMSGSPIIQHGKIIGAVTHVLVNDPTRGYGIFIEHMMGEGAH
ncbi:MAG: SpoIVB peptidase [Clostridia bacterium]|nr:SpoIVB peptidase [Clostridia bacterium]